MMPSPRTNRLRLILAAVDFSPRSAKALRYAVALARAGGGRVMAIHAVDPLLVAAAARAYSERVLVSETRADLERFVRTTLGAERARGVSSTIVVGAPRQALMAACRQRRPDVIVVGTHGRGGLSKMFFGSTTEALLRRHRGMILAIPARCPDPPGNWPGPSIVAAIGAGAHHRAMTAAAARVAELFGAWLSFEEIGARRRVARAPRGALTIMPLPMASAVGEFRQGTAAYEFLRRARGPVLVVRTRRRVGHPARPREAA